MHTRSRTLSSVLCTLGLLAQLLLPGFAEASEALPWSSLIDEEAQNYEDPYRDLTMDQLQTVLSLVRLNMKLEKVETENERTSLAEEANEMRNLLTQDAIDFDWLVSQRWIVAERRERASWAGDMTLDGQEVTLTGFAIPAPPEEDGTPSAYLVPERGMCSHMPPPPPNQMVRVRLPDDWSATAIYEPLRLTGVLSVTRSEREIVVVDGVVPMRASFSMEVSEVQSFMTAPSTEDLTSPWAEQILQRLRQTKGRSSDED